MKIYCLIRRTDASVAEANTRVDCYSSLEKAKRDLLYNYQKDIICNEHDNNVIKQLNELSYCVIINNKRSELYNSTISCEIITTDLY